VTLYNNSPDSQSKWGKITDDVPPESILDPLLFLLYINDLPQITQENSKMIIYADDTSIIITNPNPSNFENIVNRIFEDINRWLNSNLLSLIFDKTHYMQFRNKNSSPIDLNIGHENKRITKTSSTKFLGLSLENTLSWKIHIDMIVPKLSSANFAIRTLKPFLPQDTLSMIYYLYFYSIMIYGLIFWGNSHYSIIIFRRALRVIMGLRSGDSCREHFKKLKIHPLQSQYIQLLLLFVVDSKRYFKENSDIHNINTRTKSNQHQLIANLSTYQKGAYYSRIKVYSSLPTQIKDLSACRKQFGYALKSFLYSHTFYTLDEYFKKCNKH
jgi:hypothetical protein